MAGTVDYTDSYRAFSTTEHSLLKEIADNLIQGRSREIEAVEIVSDLVNN